MIDPKQLAAFVEQSNTTPMGMPGNENEMPEEPMMEDEEAAGADGQAILNEMGEFGEELLEAADTVCGLADEAGDGVTEQTDESREAVEDAVDRMPESMGMGLAESVNDLEMDELKAVADVLVSSIETENSAEGVAPEPEVARVAGFLDLASTVAYDEYGDEMEDGEEEDDDEDDDEEEDDALANEAEEAAEANPGY